MMVGAKVLIKRETQSLGCLNGWSKWNVENIFPLIPLILEQMYEQVSPEIVELS